MQTDWGISLNIVFFVKCAPETLPEAEEFGFAGLRARHKLHGQRPREDRGTHSQVRLKVRDVSLCNTAEGPSGEGSAA